MDSNILLIDESFVGSDGVSMPALHVLKDSMYNTRFKYEYKEEKPFTVVFNFEKKDFESMKHLLGNKLAIFTYDDLEDFEKNKDNKNCLVKRLKKHHIKIS